LHKLFFLKSS